jgi:hypothetical protein
MISQNLNFETIVVHSRSKAAWNIVSTRLGAKYKIAAIPYVESEEHTISTNNRIKAFEHATYINKCLNQYEEIINLLR